MTSDLKSLNKRRSQRRNRHSGNTLKLFAFYHEYRPACYGTFLQTVSSVNGRRPFVKYSQLDYEVDSDEDWESDVSDAEDVDKSDSEGEEDETGERVDGLEEVSIFRIFTFSFWRVPHNAHTFVFAPGWMASTRGDGCRCQRATRSNWR